jgi:hypothetical protein
VAELRKLGDVAALHELGQSDLDAGADAAQVADAPLSHHRRHVDRRRADELCRPPVRARAVVARAGQLEERREFLQSRRDAGVVDRRRRGASGRR